MIRWLPLLILVLYFIFIFLSSYHFIVLSFIFYFSSGNADMIRWLPLLILVLYFIFFNLGLSSYVWVITAEILPSEVTLPSFLSLV